MAVKLRVEEGVEAATDKAPKGGKNKLIPILLLVAVLLVVGIAAVVAKKVLSKKSKPAVVDTSAVGSTVELDEFLINLAGPGDDHYLKTTIGIGLAPSAAPEAFKDKIPIVRDAIVMTVSAKTLDQIKSASGKEQLKQDLVKQIDSSLKEDDVHAVYFEAFATQ